MFLFSRNTRMGQVFKVPSYTMDVTKSLSDKNKYSSKFSLHSHIKGLESHKVSL